MNDAGLSSISRRCTHGYHVPCCPMGVCPERPSVGMQTTRSPDPCAKCVVLLESRLVARLKAKQ